MRGILDSTQLLNLPVLAMLFFMAVFGVVVWRALSKRRGETYDRMAQLPLEEGE